MSQIKGYGYTVDRDMDIGECIDLLEGYGYTVKERISGRLLMDGYGLRVGVIEVEGSVVGIDCYMLKNGEIDTLLGTTAVYPNFAIRYKWVDGIRMDDMFSVLSEPGKAVMRFSAMKLEEELEVLEG